MAFARSDAIIKYASIVKTVNKIILRILNAINSAVSAVFNDHYRKVQVQ